eukprot:2394018-Prymnesium_polylepis.1
MLACCRERNVSPSLVRGARDRSRMRVLDARPDASSDLFRALKRKRRCRSFSLISYQRVDPDRDSDC